MTVLNFDLKRNPVTGSPSLERAGVRWRLEKSSSGVGGGNLLDSGRKLVLFIRYKLPYGSGAKEANVGSWLLKLGHSWVDGWTQIMNIIRLCMC